MHSVAIMSSGNPIPDAGGIQACSRWLSVAIPPDNGSQPKRTPAGVPANPHYGLDPYLPSLSYCFCHQKPRTYHCPGMAQPVTRIPWGCGSRHGWHTPGRWRRRRSCPSSDRSQTHPLPRELHARVEEILIDMGDGNDQGTKFSLAGGIRRVFRERFHAVNDSKIHRRTGRAPSYEIIPGGTHRLPQEIRCAIRRAVSRLNFNISGTPSGVHIPWGYRCSGGIALLNHRLKAVIPPGCSPENAKGLREIPEAQRRPEISSPTCC